MKRIFFICLVAFVCLSSCSKSLGYSVVLWSIPEKNICDGEILKVHIKSNITKVYVASVSDSNDKFEVPLWQLSEPMFKSRALALAEKMRSFQHIYAQVTLDGLPVRFEAENTSRQVYRLRKNEIVKIVSQGESAVLSAGTKKFEGAWYQVMTRDGTQGWCFSHNLRLYNDVENAGAVAASDEKNEIDEIVSKVWHPESYLNMIESGRIDLQELNQNYHIKFRTDSNETELFTKTRSMKFAYNGFEKTGDGVYRLNGTAITIMVRSANHILVQFDDETPEAEGFVALDRSISELIAGEKSRRGELYSRFLSPASEFESQGYGKIQFLKEQSFIWEGFSALVPNVIPKDSIGRGEISFNIFASDGILSDFDGVVTFNFEGASRPVHFLFRFDKDALVFENVLSSSLRGNLVVERGANVETCVFSPNEF